MHSYGSHVDYTTFNLHKHYVLTMKLFTVFVSVASGLVLHNREGTKGKCYEDGPQANCEFNNDYCCKNAEYCVELEKCMLCVVWWPGFMWA